MTEPSTTPQTSGARSLDLPARLLVYTVLLLGSAAYTFEASTYHPLARVAPLTIGTAATLIMIVALLQEGWRWRRRLRGDNAGGREGSIEATADPLTMDTLLPACKYTGVVIAYVVGITLVGLLLSSVALLVLLLRFSGGMQWRWIAVSVAGLCLAHWGLQEFAGLTFPDGMLGLI